MAGPPEKKKKTPTVYQWRGCDTALGKEPSARGVSKHLLFGVAYSISIIQFSNCKYYQLSMRETSRKFLLYKRKKL